MAWGQEARRWSVGILVITSWWRNHWQNWRKKRYQLMSSNWNFCISIIISSALDSYCVVVLQDCLLCPTGFSANMAVMTALGSISSLLSHGRKPAEYERIAIFSDALNHASIIDGIRLLERQQEAIVFVYKHCDMFHLDFLLYVSFSLCSNIQCIHTTWISCNYIFIISAGPVAQWKRKLLSQIGKSSLT